MLKKISLYLIDDDNNYLNSLEEYVKLYPDFEIASSYSALETDGDVEDMIENIGDVKPDVVLMDVSFTLCDRPSDFGITLTQKIKEAFADQKIIMLAQDLENDHDQYEVIKRSFRAGATAYLSKSDLPNWPEGIKETMNGHKFISPSMYDILLTGLSIAKTYNLSIREVQAIRCLSLDMRIKEVAKDMDLSFDGANFHIRNARIKLDVITNQGLVAKALREGIID